MHHGRKQLGNRTHLRAALARPRPEPVNTRLRAESKEERAVNSLFTEQRLYSQRLHLQRRLRLRRRRLWRRRLGLAAGGGARGVDLCAEEGELDGDLYGGMVVKG